MRYSAEAQKLSVNLKTALQVRSELLQIRRVWMYVGWHRVLAGYTATDYKHKAITV